MKIQTQSRETLVSPGEQLRLWTSGLEGWGGARDQSQSGRESSKNIERKGALERSLHCDLQSVVSSVFILTSDLGITLGRGEQDRKCDGGKWIQRGLMNTPQRPCPPGAYSFHSATS